MTDEIHYRGKVYPLNEWLSVEAYSQKYRLPLLTLNSYIQQGQVGAEDLLVIERWNLCLIRNKPLK